MTCHPNSQFHSIWVCPSLYAGIVPPVLHQKITVLACFSRIPRCVVNSSRPNQHKPLSSHFFSVIDQANRLFNTPPSPHNSIVHPITILQLDRLLPAESRRSPKTVKTVPYAGFKQSFVKGEFHNLWDSICTSHEPCG